MVANLLMPSPVALMVLVVAVLVMRLFCIRPGRKAASASPYRTMVVLGSGGHTSEMLRLVSSLSSEYYPRLYVVASTDTLSEQRARAFEAAQLVQGKVHFARIPRLREVGESMVSSMLSSVRAVLATGPVVVGFMPDLVLTNGPGTCLPVCLWAYAPRFLGLCYARVVYVESICRVKTLSATGRVLYWLADRLLVQWPLLKEKYPRADYLGRLT